MCVYIYSCEVKFVQGLWEVARFVATRSSQMNANDVVMMYIMM